MEGVAFNLLPFCPPPSPPRKDDETGGGDEEEEALEDEAAPPPVCRFAFAFFAFLAALEAEVETADWMARTDSREER